MRLSTILQGHFIFAFRVTLAFKVTIYGTSTCKDYKTEIVLGPDQGCITAANQPYGLSSFIESTGAIDDTFYTVFFSSDDCNPDTVTKKGYEGCLPVQYKSFTVWNVCEKDLTNCLD